MSAHHGGSAGTAGRGYKVEDDPHPFEPAPDDYGRRPVCWCGEERAFHITLIEQPARRSA